MWLHECTDVCADLIAESRALADEESFSYKSYGRAIIHTKDNAIGPISFPAPAVLDPMEMKRKANMRFTHGNTGWPA
jgi:hypothetical protein